MNLAQYRYCVGRRRAAVLAAVFGAACHNAPPPVALGPSPFDLTPLPVTATVAAGMWRLTGDTRLAVASASLEAVADAWAEPVRRAAGVALIATTNHAAPGDIALRLLAARDPRLGDEGYTLTVAPQGVDVAANTAAGVFYGLQTLRQLLPVTATAAPRDGSVWAARASAIVDAPRYAWRGFMIDVARHFFSADDLRRWIDELARLKLNRLHLHLSDDQGWRVEIAGYPQLTAVGGATAVDGGAGGYYTRAEYRALVDYAAERFVTVVPEIDMPGHTHAALASLPALNCDGVAPPPYTGTDVGFSALCPTAPATLPFIRDVIAALAAETPGSWLHLGGDEAHAMAAADYAALVTFAQAEIARQGKVTVGWEELAQAPVTPDTVVQVWLGDPDPQAVAAGARFIMSPVTRAYLDMKIDGDTPVGQIYAGFVAAEKAYDWDPATIVPSVPADRIVGVEAPLWTETVPDRASAELLMFPRLAGHAEVAWTPQHRRNVADYMRRLTRQAAHWDANAIGYYEPALPDRP